MDKSSELGRHVVSPSYRNWTQICDLSEQGHTTVSGQSNSAQCFTGMEKGLLNLIGNSILVNKKLYHGAFLKKFKDHYLWGSLSTVWGHSSRTTQIVK